MVIFKRKERVLDWRYKGQRAGEMGRMIQPRTRSKEPVTVGDIGFLGDMAGSNRGNSSSDSEDYEEASDKKKKLAKRIFDMTDKIEDLSNQIYHLQQRVDLLEKKTGRSFE